MSYEELLAPLRRGQPAEIWLITCRNALAVEGSWLARQNLEGGSPSRYFIRDGSEATWLVPRAGLVATWTASMDEFGCAGLNFHFPAHWTKIIFSASCSLQLYLGESLVAH